MSEALKVGATVSIARLGGATTWNGKIRLTEDSGAVG